MRSRALLGPNGSIRINTGGDQLKRGGSSVRRRPDHRQEGRGLGRPPADDAGEARGSGDGRKGTSRAASPLGTGEASRGGSCLWVTALMLPG